MKAGLMDQGMSSKIEATAFSACQFFKAAAQIA